MMAHYYFNNTPHGKCKDGSKLNTKAHYNYICRENQYAHMHDRAEDFVLAKSGNMPSWAETPGEFWEKAEENRRVNGRAYREIRLGLQEEFTIEENQELVEQFMKDIGIADHHAYSYAIHDKEAAFDDTHRNIHCHLMFNEKIIEKDRPLGPETYFKRYTENTLGNPNCGYKSNRYFHDKESMIQMRKHWADLVNAKFAEKGMDIRISEKTLDKQRKELIAQGKNEEADRFNRTPAPHMGRAYRNPKNMELIKERIQQIDEATEAAANGEPTEETTEDMTEQERKIVIFATDVLLRRIGREIQEERLRLQKEAGKEHQEHEDKPVIVTLGDVMDEMENRIDVLTQSTEVSMQQYKELRAKVLNQKKIESAVLNQAFHGEYDRTRKAYAQAAKKVDKIKQSKADINRKDPVAVEQYTLLLGEALQQRNELGQKLAEYRQAGSGSQKGKIDDIRTAMEQENTQRIKEAQRLYGQIMRNEKEKYRYAQKLGELTQNGIRKDTILYADRLPKQLSTKCKLHGEKPLWQQPKHLFQGREYVCIDKVQPANGNDNEFTVRAVRIGDDMDRGKAQVYLLTLSSPQDKKSDTYIVHEAKPIHDTEAMYHAHHKMKKPDTKQMGAPPSEATAIKSIPQQTDMAPNMQHAINSMLHKVMEDKKGRYQAWWKDDDNTYKKDAVERAEEEMDRGWTVSF